LLFLLLKQTNLPPSGKTIITFKHPIA